MFPQAALMVSIPFRDGNCGGRRLNQYTLTMEIMYTSAKPAHSDRPTMNARQFMARQGGFGLPAPDDVGIPSFQTQAQPTEADKLKPVFSTASYAETEVFSLN